MGRSWDSSPSRSWRAGSCVTAGCRWWRSPRPRSASGSTATRRRSSAATAWAWSSSCSTAPSHSRGCGSSRARLGPFLLAREKYRHDHAENLHGDEEPDRPEHELLHQRNVLRVVADLGERRALLRRHRVHARLELEPILGAHGGELLLGAHHLEQVLHPRRHRRRDRKLRLLLERLLVLLIRLVLGAVRRRELEGERVGRLLLPRLVELELPRRVLVALARQGRQPVGRVEAERKSRTLWPLDHAGLLLGLPVRERRAVVHGDALELRLVRVARRHAALERDAAPDDFAQARLGGLQLDLGAAHAERGP